MAQGSKYTDEQKEQALAMLTTMSVKAVSENLNIPENTLRDWKKNAEKTNPEFVELRNEKKKQFVEKAWNIMEKANQLLERKLDRALTKEKELDDALDELYEETDFEKKKDREKYLRVARKVDALKMENIGQLSTVIGTMYDKQALINKEATVNHGADTSLEQVLRNLQGEEM